MIKPLIKKILARQGLEVRRTGVFTSDAFVAQERLCFTPKPTIIDVGAHHGETALSYQRFFPKSRIYCIEPCEDSFQELTRLQASNPRISAHKMAITDTCGTKKLYENELAVTNSLFPVSEKASATWGVGKIIPKGIKEVSCTTLDHFAAEFDIDQINILKLDIQGSEYCAIMGASKLISENRIDMIFMEVILSETYLGQSGPFAAPAALAEFGYNLVGLYNMLYKDSKLIQFDALFARNNL